MTKVAFAGLGRMGSPMATNLAAAGFEVALWNRTSERAEELAERIGARVANSPRELAADCEVVITMLADDQASEEVHLGEDGLFAARGAFHLVEMGTMSPSHIRLLAQHSNGRTVIDAPVSGSVDAARDATLLVMVGATESETEPVRVVLSAMSRRIVCLGRTGAGAAMKLAINLLIHGLNQTLAEALTLAEAAGIDIELAYEIVEQSAAAAPMLSYRKAQYLHEETSPVTFALSLARKDVTLALSLAATLGVELPQTATNLDLLRRAEASGAGERDMAAMVQYMRGLE